MFKKAINLTAGIIGGSLLIASCSSPNRPILDKDPHCICLKDGTVVENPIMKENMIKIDSLCKKNYFEGIRKIRLK